MSLHQNENWNEHQKEIADENPFSFENIIKFMGSIDKAIYGINPYEKIAKKDNDAFDKRLNEFVAGMDDGKEALKKAKEYPIGYFKDKEVEATNPDD